MVKVPVVGQQGVRVLRKGHADGRLPLEGGQLRVFGQDITNLVNLHRKDHKPHEIEHNKPARVVLKRAKAKPRPRPAGTAAPARKRLESGAGIFSRTRSRRKTGNDKGKIIQSRIITRKGQQSKKSTRALDEEAWITKGPSVSIESRPSTHLETMADKRNFHVPGAVSLYHADIVEFLRVQEPILRPVKPRPGNAWHASGCVPHHLSPVDADYHDRTVLADWIAKVCREFGLKDETLLLSLNLLDRCIGIPSSLIKDLEPLLLAIGCMRVASKYEEILVNHIDDFLKLVQHSYSRKDVVSAEFAILEMINFQIIQPGHISVTERIKTLLRIKEEDNQNEVVSQTSIFLVKLGLVYGPSALIHGDQFMLACAAGLLCAEKVYGANTACLQKLCEVLAVDLESISMMVGHLLALLKQSVRHQPSNPVRRTFLHRVGMGSGNSAESLLLK